MQLHPTGIFDNSARNYAHITAKPLSAAMGVEIEGVDIPGMTEQQFLEVEDALFRHKMLYFRDQELTFADQENFTLRFGDFGIDAYTAGAAGHKNVQPVIKEADTKTRMIFGSGWHTDSPFMETPPAISMLYGVDIPPYGGDTIWCNSALAYQCLSQTMQNLLSSLRVHMSASGVIGQLESMKMDGLSDGQKSAFARTERDEQTKAMVDGWFHPIIRTHPKSGEKALFVDHTYSRGIEGMTQEEADAILGFLKQHITQAAFSCRLRWSPGTLALWDNRLCIHQAFNDYDGFRREMYRTTVHGEVPV